MLWVVDRQPHRYRLARTVAQALSLALLAAAPLASLARFDLWAGRHRFLGRAVDATGGAAGALLGLVALYVVAFAANEGFGRLFCGFVCPAGQAARHADEADAARALGRGRAAAEARAVLHAVAVAAAGALWWVDPRVVTEGSAGAAVAAAAGVGALAFGVWAHGRWWRWRPCRALCPARPRAREPARVAFGAQFAAALGTCRRCDACAEVCPTGERPREREQGGAACLACGDCVRACEAVFRRRGAALAPLSLGTAPKGRRALPVLAAAPDRATT